MTGGSGYNLYCPATGVCLGNGSVNSYTLLCNGVADCGSLIEDEGNDGMRFGTPFIATPLLECKC